VTLLVGFCGRARHGKDWLAAEVHAALPRDTKVYSLANALKVYARVAGLMTKKDGPLLQALGTEVFRRVRPNVWIDVIKYTIEEEQPRVAHIADVRFVNEHDWIKNQDGLTYKVQRLNADGTPYLDLARNASHASECQMDTIKEELFDGTVIATSGDLKTLAEAARLIAIDIARRMT